MALLTEDTRVLATARPRRANTERSRQRRWTFLVGVGLIGFSLWRAGISGIWNSRGLDQLGKFFGAAVHPSFGAEFRSVIVDATIITLGLAVVGTALTLVIGFSLGPLLSERFWTRPGTDGLSLVGLRWIRTIRALAAAPRTLHEVVWALLLLTVFGLDPIVGVLAIGVPFGLVTANVVGETIDDARDDVYALLRNQGASRWTALTYGIGPRTAKDLLSFSFYRFECSLRSAAVLGVVGAGGLGYQIVLSFQTLDYSEMWTAIYVLCMLGAAGDSVSALLRRRLATGFSARWMTGTILSAGALTLWFWVRLDLQITALFDADVRARIGDQWRRSWPPDFRTHGALNYFEDAVDTVAMSIIAIVASAAVAFMLALSVAFPRLDSDRRGWGLRQVYQWATKVMLLVMRAVPPPVWALLALFVIQPGIWSAAVALAVYNTGVLGRLLAETIENADTENALRFHSAGASRLTAHAYGTLPSVFARLVGLIAYRWEVIVRDSVVVGYIGTSGLGRTLHQQLATFAERGATATLLLLFVLTVAIDRISRLVRGL